VTKNGVSRVLPRRLPSPAMIVACVALTVALGGTSYAAIRLPANSVGTKQLKRGAVTGVKVKRNSLTGAQVVESRLGKVPSATSADNADRADEANSAPVSRLDYRQSAPAAVPASGHVRASASCDGATFAIGGGAKVSDPNNAFVIDTNPLGKNAWEGTATALTTGTTLTVYVICAQAAGTTP
jgi:hypothetical protein